MAATAGNPYTAPRKSVPDAAPRLGLATRATRALAFLGNAFLLVLPLVLFFSSRRSETGFLVMSGYCVAVALASTMALAFRDRFSFWAGLTVNVLGVALTATLAAYLAASGDSDWWTLLFLAVPTALNLCAVLLVRRSRGPSDDTLASRR